MRSKLVVILTVALFLGCCAGLVAADRAQDVMPDQIAFRAAPLVLDPAGGPRPSEALPDRGAVPPPAQLPAGAPPAPIRC